MSTVPIEARVAALTKRFHVIEVAIRELQQRHETASVAPSKKRKDPASLTALLPNARDTPEVAALRKWCLAHKIHTAEFKWVPSDYYSQNLQWRRDVLGAPTIQHLCKTIVLENTQCENKDCSNYDNSRYYMIVYRYVDRFNAEMVMRVMRERNPGLGKRKFNYRLANPETALALTGFGHGAVCPVGTATPIPVILSAEITLMSPAHFWMGGGHVDCKVRIDVEEFLAVVKPIVAAITVPLTPEELEQIAD